MTPHSTQVRALLRLAQEEATPSETRRRQSLAALQAQVLAGAHAPSASEVQARREGTARVPRGREPATVERHESRRAAQPRNGLESQGAATKQYTFGQLIAVSAFVGALGFSAGRLTLQPPEEGLSRPAVPEAGHASPSGGAPSPSAHSLGGAQPPVEATGEEAARSGNAPASGPPEASSLAPRAERQRRSARRARAARESSAARAARNGLTTQAPARTSQEKPPSRQHSKRATDARKQPGRAGRKASFQAVLRGLERARAALRGGRPTLALLLLEELKRARAGELLWEERSVAEGLALCALDRVEDAQRIAKRLLEANPDSIYSQRLRSSCASQAVEAPFND